MLIQLRQSEIETALRDYIVNQGISLIDRTVEISFTSGRKDNGISADMDITDLPRQVYVSPAIPTGPIKRGFSEAPVEIKDACPIKDPEEATDETDFPEDIEEPVATVETKTAASLFN